jgi:hypothetical protein
MCAIVFEPCDCSFLPYARRLCHCARLARVRVGSVSLPLRRIYAARSQHTLTVQSTRVQAQIHDLMVAAFKEPLVAKKMIGFRFTVGGGKKVRQKYGDGMPKCAPSHVFCPRGCLLRGLSQFTAAPWRKLSAQRGPAGTAWRRCAGSASRRTAGRARSWRARACSSTSTTPTRTSSLSTCSPRRGIPRPTRARAPAPSGCRRAPRPRATTHAAPPRRSTPPPQRQKRPRPRRRTPTRTTPW